MKCFIYKITNLVNGKIYIGSSSRTLSRRFSTHLNDIKNGSQAYFHKAIRKYGKDNFKKEIIFFVFDQNELEIFESFFIEHFNSKNRQIGYNQHDPILGNSLYIADVMKKEWANPIKREKRLLSMTAGSKKKPVVAVNINSATISRYESVQSAIRNGYSASSLCNSLKRKVIKGQGSVWFYDEGQEDDYFIKETEKLIDFKPQNTYKIQTIDKSTGKIQVYGNIMEVIEDGYKPKYVNRAIRNPKRTLNNKFWSYLP